MKYLLVFIIALILFWTFGAFVSLEPNVLKWTDGSRALLFIWCLVFPIGLFSFDYVEGKFEKKK